MPGILAYSPGVHCLPSPDVCFSVARPLSPRPSRPPSLPAANVSCDCDERSRWLPAAAEQVIAPSIRAGKRVCICGHENNLRSLLKHVDGVSAEVRETIAVVVGTVVKRASQGTARQGSVYLSVCLSVCLCVCLPVCVSVCLCVCVSVCL